MKRGIRTAAIAVLILIVSSIGAAACFAADDAENPVTMTVYVTLSDDSDFLRGRDGKVMAHVPITVSYFDLKDYGLEDFYRLDDDDNVIKSPTVLHLLIKMVEQYYAGRTLGPEDMHSSMIDITGAPKSLWINHLLGHDGNLMYFVNHSYPLMSARWGATADYILLSPGDEIDLAMYTDWTFYNNSAFLYFERTEVNGWTGQDVRLKLLAKPTSIVNDGIDTGSFVMPNEPIRYSKDYGRTWTAAEETSRADGVVSLPLKEPGTYYVATGPAHANYKDAAPAICVVNVQEGDGPAPPPDQEAEDRAAAVQSAQALLSETAPALEKESEYGEACFAAFKETYEALSAMVEDASAKSTDIFKAVSALREAYDALKTKAEELAEAKTAAVTEVSEYKVLSDYRETEQEVLKGIVSDAVAAIEAADTVAAVEAKVTEAKAAMDELKTAAELDEEERVARESAEKARAAAVRTSRELLEEASQYAGKSSVYTVKSYKAFDSARKALEELIGDSGAAGDSASGAAGSEGNAIGSAGDSASGSAGYGASESAGTPEDSDPLDPAYAEKTQKIDSARVALKTAMLLLKKKAAQPMKVSAAGQKTFKASMLKKSAKTFKAVTVSGAKGAVTYKVSGTAASKKVLSFNKKTGKVTVKKGTKKGSYSIKVKAAAAGNGNYLAGSKTVTIKVRVK